MLQSYKLRLGDGTILLVDRAGLGSWLGDRKALVQPVGSDLWMPLKGFLAQERSSARRAARHQPKPPSTSRDALPLVYPKPREEPASGPPGGLPLIPPTPPSVSPTPPTVSLKPRDDLDEVPRPAQSVPHAPVALPAEPTVVQPLAEEPATLSAESVPPLLPSDEDVGWMTLPKSLDDEPPALPDVAWNAPLEPSSTSERPSLFQQLSQWINSLARRDWQATRLWLISQAASAYGAVLALWKNLAPAEPAPSRAVDSERSAPPGQRPTVGVPLGVRVLKEKGTDSLGVYSPRRSTVDGLPILQLEPLDDEDDAPEIVLEPLDDELATGAPRRRNPPVRLRAKG